MDGVTILYAPQPCAPLEPLVLVADDEAMPRMLAGRAIEKAGFRVLYAKDGREAVDVFATHQPDVVLLDVKMPRCDGYSACAEIRAAAGGEGVAVVMMTACDDTESIDAAFAVGATDFLPKPVNPALLPHRLRYLHRNTMAARKLRESEGHLRAAERIAKVGHWVWDLRDGRITLSCEAARMLGVTTEDATVIEALFHAVPAHERRQIVHLVRQASRNGSPFTIEHRLEVDGEDAHAAQEGSVERGDDGAPIRVVATIQDVTERHEAQREILRLAYFDSLTGLANRPMLRRHLERVVDMSRRYRRNAAVLCLDLDRFKNVNDTMGHTAGDELLVAVGNRLRQAMRRSDCLARPSTPPEPAGDSNALARQGGDEFTIVLSEIRRAEDAALVADRILEELSRPFTLGRDQIFVGASIGIAVFPDDGADAEELLKNADAALYHAKEQGRHRHAFFKPSLNEANRRRLELEIALRSALANDELELHFQPKVLLEGGRVVGVEALLRWTHPEQGRLSPAEFIPVAEDSGLIVPIGARVLTLACEQLARWNAAGLDGLTMSVNVASRQFRDEEFVSFVQETLEKTGIRPRNLELEITERTLMDDTEISLRVLGELRALGIRVAIDDFGTGYSSLSYLKRFPIDVIKVDRSFVADIPTDGDSSAIAEAIIAMGNSLDMEVVAEGVETEAQMDFLARSRCPSAQGFLFCRPLPAEEVERWCLDNEASRGGDGG